MAPFDGSVGCAGAQQGTLNPSYSVTVLPADPSPTQGRGTEADRLCGGLGEHRHVRQMFLEFRGLAHRTRLHRGHRHRTLGLVRPAAVVEVTDEIAVGCASVLFPDVPRWPSIRARCLG